VLLLLLLLLLLLAFLARFFAEDCPELDFAFCFEPALTL
jgi:hypothetical protein